MRRESSAVAGLMASVATAWQTMWDVKQGAAGAAGFGQQAADVLAVP